MYERWFDEWNTLESRLQPDRMIQISTRRLNFMDHQLWLQRVQEWGAGIFRFFLSKCRQRARQNHYLPVSGLIVPNVKWNRREEYRTSPKIIIQFINFVAFYPECLNNASRPTSHTTNTDRIYRSLMMNNEARKWTVWRSRNRLICTEKHSQLWKEPRISWWDEKESFHWRHIWHEERRRNQEKRMKSYIENGPRKWKELNGWNKN